MAAWVAPVIAAGASLLSGLMSSSASKNAAKAQARAAQQATEEERRQFDLTRADLAPYRDVGEQSLYKLADLLGIKYGNAPVMPLAADYTTTQPGYWTEPMTTMFGTGSDSRTVPGRFVAGKTLFNQAGYDAAMAEYRRKKAEYDAQQPSGDLLKKFTLEDFHDDPGYQFQLDQGEQAINRAAAARGNRYAGGTLKELLRFNTGLADTTYQNAFNRDAAEKSRIYGFLTGTTGQGQSTATTLGQLGQATANNIGNNLMQAGNANAAGIVGSANALTSGIGNALSFWNQYNWLNKNNPNSIVSTGGYSNNTPLSNDPSVYFP